jgi:hypothetical protein
MDAARAQGSVPQDFGFHLPQPLNELFLGHRFALRVLAPERDEVHANAR